MGFISNFMGPHFKVQRLMNRTDALLFFEGISLSISNTICRWWANNREATHEYLAPQAQSLLD